MIEVQHKLIFPKYGVSADISDLCGFVESTFVYQRVTSSSEQFYRRLIIDSLVAFREEYDEQRSI